MVLGTDIVVPLNSISKSLERKVKPLFIICHMGLCPESVHLAMLHQEFTVGQSHTERLGPLLGCQHYAVKLLTLKINSVQQEYSPGRSGFGKHFRI